MASTMGNTPPPTLHQSAAAPTSPAQQTTPLQNDTVSPQSPQTDPVRVPLSPGDCRTLEKILEDVRGPESEGPAVSTALDVILAQGRMTNDEEEFEGEGEGYEDEDMSAELSDWYRDDDGDQAHNQSVSELEEADGDTVEDVMNMPGETAPPAAVQDFSDFDVDEQGAIKSEELKVLLEKRAMLEKKLEKERVEKELIQPAAAENDTYEDSTILGDVEKSPLKFATFNVVGTPQEHPPHIAAPLRQFAVKPPPHSRRYSEDELLPWSASDFVPRDPSSAFPPSYDHEDENQVSMDETRALYKEWNDRLENTLHKGKENSPSKRRRKAASPEEIAELLRVVSGEATNVDVQDTPIHSDEINDMDNQELEDLDKYRETDLAPLEHVMESGAAGDLITFGTPVRAKDVSLLNSESQGLGLGLGKKVETAMEVEPQTPKLDSTAKNNRQPEVHDTPSSPLPSTLLTNQLTTSTTPTKLTGAEEYPTRSPSSEAFQPSTTTADQNEAKVHSNPAKEQDHPVFTTIIAMLPQTMFWAAAAPITKYASKAYDVLVEKMTGLKLDKEE